MQKWLQILLLLAIVAVPLIANAGDPERMAAVRMALGCEPEVLTQALTDAQLARIAELGGRVSAKTVARYRPSCSAPTDRRSAYVLTRNVRTLPQTLLVVIGHDDTVEKVELLSFLEPAEYKGTARWYRAFAGRALNDDLNVQRAIPLMAGATITSRSTTQVVREVLALHMALLGR